MRLAGLPFLVLATSLTTAAMAPSRAVAGDEVGTVVLGIEPLEGAPDAVAAEITDALRQRVAATKGYQLLQGKDLVEVKLVFACPDAAPACMSTAGKSLGADKVIFGNVKRAGNDYQLTLKMLDVSRAVVESFTAETVTKKHADAAGLRASASGWLAKLSGKGGGSIQVRANFPGAAVSLDGTQVGTTGSSPVVIPDVAPGRHEVTVEKSGYTTTKQEFTLASGQSLPLNLTLSPVSVEVVRPENAGKGRIKGVEANVQTFFNFLPGWLSGFGVQANVTYLDAKNALPAAFGGEAAMVPMINVSKWTYNLAAFYEKGPLSARLSYNRRSHYVNQYNRNVDESQYVGEQSRAVARLDASISYEFSKHLSLVATASNILGQPFNDYRYYNQTQYFPSDLRVEGRYFSLGARFKF